MAERKELSATQNPVLQQWHKVICDLPGNTLESFDRPDIFHTYGFTIDGKYFFSILSIQGQPFQDFQPGIYIMTTIKPKTFLNNQKHWYSTISNIVSPILIKGLEDSLMSEILPDEVDKKLAKKLAKKLNITPDLKLCSGHAMKYTICGKNPNGVIIQIEHATHKETIESIVNQYKTITYTKLEKNSPTSSQLF